MASYIDFNLTFTDNSSGDRAEDGTEVQIYTDSPSYKPTVKVDYNAARHAWMALPLVNAGVTTLPIKLKAPVTFVKVRVRQFNANGFGEWNAPGGAAGVLFPFNAGTGAVNAPDAPTNVGLIITGTPTPPVDPPDDPPPTEEPPPTGGGGTSGNYAFTAQFSSTQGMNQWSYLDALDVPLTFSSGVGYWIGAQEYQGLWQGGIHPGPTVGTKLRWTAPADGTAIVTGSVQLLSASGFGVTFTMKHESTTIDGAASLTTTTPRVFNETVVVVTGDVIDFIVAPNSGNSYCSTALAPSIQLTTDGTTPADPVLSSLSPASLPVAVQGVGLLTVTLTSAPGANAVVSVSSSATGVATVPATVTIAAGQTSQTIQVLGVAPGASTITATYNAVPKTSVVSVNAAPTAAWPNAPVGGSTLFESNCNSISGLLDFYNSTLTRTDNGAPASPPGCLVHRLEAFARNGGGETHFVSPTRWREHYVGVMWRTNVGYLGRPVGNKLFFQRGGTGSNAFWFLKGRNSLQVTSSGGQLAWSSNGGFDNTHILPGDGLLALPNVNDPVIIPGVWYQFEMYIKSSTTPTARNGELRWWVNKSLTGSYTGLNYCSSEGVGLHTWVWTETWDGSGDMGTSNTVPWEYWLDHILIVGKN